MAAGEIHFSDVSEGRPFHAAFVTVAERWPDRPAPHGHADFYEMMYVVDGHGHQRLPTGDVPLQQGTLAVIRPGDWHEFAASRAALRFVNVAFPSATWDAFIDWAQPAARGWLSGPRPLLTTLDGTARGRVEEEFHRALQAFNRSPSHLDLGRLWCHVLPAIEESLPAHVPDRDTRPPWLTRTCEAMEDGDNLRAGLPRMLTLAAVSPSHLARTMRRHYGCTAIAYVNDRRLDRAALLLATTADSITAIAARCGFDSPSYFTRRFRRRFNCSPRQYRRSRQDPILVAPGIGHDARRTRA